MEFLLRLWGHCEANQRGADWGKVTPDYVEAVCRWPRKRGELYAALLRSIIPGKAGWIEEREGRVVIHDWETHNNGLMMKWLNGKKGGRPPKTRSEPTDNLQVSNGITRSEPTDNPPPPLLKGIKLKGIKGKGREPVSPPDLNFGSDVNCPPGIEEVISYGRKLTPPAPEEVCRKFWLHHQGNHWGSQNKSPMLDFRPHLLNWWQEDCDRADEQAEKSEKKSAPKNAAPEDEARWWDEGLDALRDEARSLFLAGDENSKKQGRRIREIIAEREKGGA